MSLELSKIVGDAVLSGVGYGALAYFTSPKTCPKGAFTYSLSNSVIRTVAVSVGNELFSKTPTGRLAYNIFVIGSAITGGMYITKQLEHKITQDDVFCLGIGYCFFGAFINS